MGDCLEEGRIGIFESPTGTGKTLSMICGSMSWLKRPTHKPILKKKTTTTEAEAKDGSEDDWVAQATRERAKAREQEEERIREKKRAEMRKTLDEIRRGRGPSAAQQHQQQQHHGGRGKPPAKKAKKEDDGADDEEELCAEDYTSQGEEQTKGPTENSQEDGKGVDEEDGGYEETKVLFCSRTHSQLSQFVGEFNKTKWAADTPLVCLASRKQLCINPSVNGKDKSAMAINEGCMDLVERGKCHFCTDKQQETLFRNYALAQPLDIEELAQLGRTLQCCPYFGVRRAVRYAEVVVLPYQMVLHRQTRESLGVNLAGNCVVVDEAHNLADAVNSVYSCELTRSQIEASHEQLCAYRDRFLRRLSAKNLVYVKLLINVIEGLKRIASPQTVPKDGGGATSKASNGGIVMTTNEFAFAAGIDAFNMFKLVRFCDKSRIAFKAHGLHETQLKKEAAKCPQQQTHPGKSHRPPLLQLSSFLEAICNPASDGRVIVTVPRSPADGGQGEIRDENGPDDDEANSSDASLRYVLLNPEKHFREVVDEARSVVLAGGTLEPVSTLFKQLFDPSQRSRIMRFSCGHVIPPENLLVLPLCEGPSKVPFEFTFSTRSSLQLTEDLGRALTNFVSVVPDGVVVFFPSYSQLDTVVDRWRRSGVLQSMEKRKRVLMEPRDAQLVAGTLDKYRGCIEASFPGSAQQEKGAVLLCVVGGKMSEGINFSDGMGRCVVVVGMPYANINDPVLKERIKLINAPSTAEALPLSDAHSEAGSSSSFYSNLCMKAVNQSIGRAIRHANDYAVVILADRRYARQETRAKLPKWMASQIPSPIPESFPAAFASAAKFFAAKRASQSAIEDQRKRK